MFRTRFKIAELFHTSSKTVSQSSKALFLFILSGFGPVLAQTAAPLTEDRWYDVELLIFKYSNPEEFASENWPERWSVPGSKNSVDIENIKPEYRADFQGLGPKSFGGMQEKLDKSVRYEVLNYSSWRQRGLNKEQAIPVHIRAGRKYLPLTPLPAGGEFGLFEESFIEQDFLPQVTIRRYSLLDSPQAKTGNALYELEGDVKIVLSRYLHVYTDLLLLKPVTLTPVEPAPEKSRNRNTTGRTHDPLASYRIGWTAPETATPAAGQPLSETSGASETLYGFNIKAHRRMRSGELHHIDHPLLGILIQIKPVETARP